MFLLCKEGTEETPIKNPSQGIVPCEGFFVRVFLVLFLQEKNRIHTAHTAP